MNAHYHICFKPVSDLSNAERCALAALYLRHYMVYRTMIETVCWPGQDRVALDGRLAQPEVALL